MMDNVSKAICWNKSNPVYYINEGLLYARQDTAINLCNFVMGRTTRSTYLERSLDCFLQAEKIAVDDPLCHLNTGILYALKGEKQQAESYLRKAAYHTDEIWNLLAWGIFCENQTDLQHTQKAYTEALKAAPDLLDSRFFVDLRSRDNVLAETIVLEAKRQLSGEYEQSHDPVLAAKLGKIAWSMGNWIEAEKLLKEATDQLPGMNRPWLYLGQIAEYRKNDSILALQCYERAIALDETDGLPLYHKEHLLNRKDTCLTNVDAITSYSKQHVKYLYLYGALLSQQYILLKDYDNYIKVDFCKSNIQKVESEKPIKSRNI
jgi:tetratricopeptide (TPR) repeat protein